MVLHIKSSPDLGEDNLLRAQLPHQRLQLRPAHVVLERAQVELARCAIQHAYAERLFPIFVLLSLIFTNRHAMSGLLVGQQFGVDERAVGEDFVQLAADDLVF